MLGTLRSRWKTNSSAVHLQHLAERAAVSVAAGDRVLHIAPADFFFPALFRQTQYVTVDAAAPGPLNVSNALSADDRYTLILCTHAIEHAPDPLATLKELQANLRPGGRLWLTAPLYYAEHQEPDDYSRYTRAGLRRLVETAGFEIEQVDWLEGYSGTLAYSFRMAFEGLPVSPRCYGGGLGGWVAAVFANVVVRPTCAVFATVFYYLDLRHKHTESGFCRCYQLIARRPL